MAEWLNRIKAAIVARLIQHHIKDVVNSGKDAYLAIIRDRVERLAPLVTSSVTAAGQQPILCEQFIAALRNTCTLGKMLVERIAANPEVQAAWHNALEHDAESLPEVKFFVKELCTMADAVDEQLSKHKTVH